MSWCRFPWNSLCNQNLGSWMRSSCCESTNWSLLKRFTWRLLAFLGGPAGSDRNEPLGSWFIHIFNTFMELTTYLGLCKIHLLSSYDSKYHVHPGKNSSYLQDNSSSKPLIFRVHVSLSWFGYSNHGVFGEAISLPNTELNLTSASTNLSRTTKLDVGKLYKFRCVFPGLPPPLKYSNINNGFSPISMIF